MTEVYASTIISAPIGEVWDVVAQERAFHLVQGVHEESSRKAASVTAAAGKG